MGPVRPETPRGCWGARRPGSARVIVLVIIAVLGGSAVAVAMVVRAVDRRPETPRDARAVAGVPEDPDASETESPLPRDG